MRKSIDIHSTPVV